MLNVKSLRVLVIFLDEEWVHEHKHFWRSDIKKNITIFYSPNKK